MSREITDDERRAINMVVARRWLETRIEPKDYAARLQEIVADHLENPKEPPQKNPAYKFVSVPQ